MFDAFFEVFAAATAIVVCVGVLLVLGAVFNRGNNRTVPASSPRRPPASPLPGSLGRSGGMTEEPHRLVRVVPYFDPRSAETRYEAWCACRDKELFLPSRQSADAWIVVHASVSKTIDEARRQA